MLTHGSAAFYATADQVEELERLVLPEDVSESEACLGLHNGNFLCRPLQCPVSSASELCGVSFAMKEQVQEWEGDDASEGTIGCPSIPSCGNISA